MADGKQRAVQARRRYAPEEVRLVLGTVRGSSDVAAAGPAHDAGIVAGRYRIRACTERLPSEQAKFDVTIARHVGIRRGAFPVSVDHRSGDLLPVRIGEIPGQQRDIQAGRHPQRVGPILFPEVDTAGAQLGARGVTGPWRATGRNTSPSTR